MNNRPVNLNLFTIRFPITAISSILHRITGVLLFLGIPLFLCALQHSLRSETGFNHVWQYSNNIVCASIMWVFLSALGLHIIAGLRHLLMDLHIGEGKCSGKLGALLVLVFSAMLSIAIGVKLLW